MSARKAFVLGALVGAGVLAAVGAVSAGGNRPVRSASSQTAGTQIARMGQRAEVPPTALPELAAIDERLNRLVNLAENLDLAALLPTEINAIDELKRQFGDKYLQAGLGFRTTLTIPSTTISRVWTFRSMLRLAI